MITKSYKDLGKCILEKRHMCKCLDVETVLVYLQNREEWVKHIVSSRELLDVARGGEPGHTELHRQW